MDFVQARKHAAEKGYSVYREKNGSFSGECAGIELEDENIDSLLDDLDALKEIETSDVYSIEPEPDADDNNVVTATVNGADMTFLDPSIAKALAKAKEAVLKHAPAPKAGGTRRRKAGAPEAAAEESVESVDAAAGAPGTQEVLPPIPGEPTQSSVPKGGQLLHLVDSLINALQSVRNEFAMPQAPSDPATSKPRGRPRRNGT